MELKVIVIVGPTCSGKTSLSLLTAEKINSEIISADSRQFYKFLDIGTAKPTQNEVEKIKHHLLDFLNPNEDYNASKFEKDAINIISELHRNCKIPIVVGGSGLYIKALVDGIFDEVDTNENYRTELLELKKKHGNNFLYELLEKNDPITAKNLLPQNWKRIIRALEVYHITGKPIWKFYENQKRDINFKFYQFGLNWNREILYLNIEKRVDEMITVGLVDEVKNILKMGYDKQINSLNTVGYKEIIDFLDGNITLDRAIELIKRNTRRYAKRQLTWFRKDERIKWFDVEKKDQLFEISDRIVRDLNKS